MSDTFRKTSQNPIWKPGNPIYEKIVNDPLIRNGKKRVQSIKHQQKDRNKPSKRKGGKCDRFTKNGKNSLYNLRKKVEKLKLKEELDLQ